MLKFVHDVIEKHPDLCELLQQVTEITKESTALFWFGFFLIVFLCSKSPELALTVFRQVLGATGQTMTE